MKRDAFKSVIAAVHAMNRHGVRVLMQHRSTALERDVVSEVGLPQLCTTLLGDPTRPPGYCQALYAHPEGVLILHNLSQDEKAAMQLLGLWPETVETHL